MKNENIVYLITYHKSINYGSVLQCYALSTYLSNNGYETYVINYQNDNQKKAFSLYETNSGIKSFIKNTYRFFHRKTYHNKIHKFSDFIEKHISETQPFYTEEELFILGKTDSAFVTGSDQVWNTDCVDFDKNYMLGFVDNKKRCLSFAASTNLTSIEKNKTLFIENVKDFSAISVREKDSALALSKLLNKDVFCCCDPVFLADLGDWESLALESNIKLPEEYVFCYFIGRNNKMLSYAKRIAKETCKKLVIINDNISNLFVRCIKKYDCGPSDFLKILKNSSYIITDSFHAVCFSIIFRKNFYVYSNNQVSNRINQILSVTGLRDRKISDFSLAQPISNVDYSQLECSNFVSFIRESKKFLLKNLEHVNDR